MAARIFCLRPYWTFMGRALRGEERWAATCIELALDSVKVCQHDDGSRPGMHDFDLWRGDARIGAVEVTAAPDSALLELWNLVNGGGKRWIESGLMGGWMVTLSPLTRTKTLRAELHRLLASLEAAGVRVLDEHRGTTASWSEEAARLGVISAHRSATAFPGSIYLTIDLPAERAVGAVPSTGDPLVEWIGEWVTGREQAENLEKLKRSGDGEKHLFVLLPGFNTAPFTVADLLLRSDAPIPESAPNLPLKLTHVWVMSTWSSGDGFYWSDVKGWARFKKVLEVTE